mmetsp:Transcript_3355/g.11826  ORF Transcript_3355/g.11826 Transcript_3355/m.11826 type:complete len:241 (-) Transcript_3355:123-845(-)
MVVDLVLAELPESRALAADDADLKLACLEILAQNALQCRDAQPDRLVHRQGLLALPQVSLHLLLQPVRAFDLLGSSAGGVVPGIVASRVNLVQHGLLVVLVVVVNSDQHGLHGHDSHVGVLGVHLVVVREPLGENVAGHFVTELEPELRGLLPRLLGDRPGIRWEPRGQHAHGRGDGVDVRAAGRIDELVRRLQLCHERDSVCSTNPDRRVPAALDGFERILDLIQSSLGTENRKVPVVR